MILYRYIAKEFLKPFIVTSIAFGTLVLVSEFFRELNYYMEVKAGLIPVLSYLLCNLPWWTIQVLPVSVLLAVLFCVGQLVKNNELTALKAAGINLWRVVVLFLLMGALIGVCEFYLREGFIPFSVGIAEKIKTEKIRNEKPSSVSDRTNLLVSFDNGKARMTVGKVSLINKTMSKLVIDVFDNNMELNKQFVAGGASWNGNGWVLENGIERVFSGNTWSEKYFLTLPFALPFSPSDFDVLRVRPEQLSISEYNTYLKRLELIGSDNTKEKIQYHQRFAAVFSHIIVILIGLPFALSFGKTHGKIISFTIALIFAFVYWAAQAAGQSLGENAVISPMLAAWIGNIVFGIFGLVLVARVKK